MNHNLATTAIPSRRLDNGLTLLVEPIPGVASAGMTLLLPAGAAVEPTDRRGVGALLAEMLFRGAGELDAKAHSDALDRLGVHRSSELRMHHLRVGAVMMGDRIVNALPLLLDMVRRPHLGDDAFEPTRQLALASIDALEDEPQQKVMLELKKRHIGEPLGRSTLGEADHIEAMTADDVRDYYRARMVPGGAILALAGAVDFDAVCDQVGELLEGWTGSADEAAAGSIPLPSDHHIQAETAQHHIALAYDTVGELDPASMVQRVAIGVLSGGMSGRLFTEVRENRGLCYSVYASYAAMRERGTVYAYAGTTPQRAAETLEVLEAELRRLSDGVSEDEFQRAVVGLKARLVMQGESTSARAGAIAADQFMRQHPRTLSDVAAELDAVTLDDVNAFVAAHRPEAFSTMTIGPTPLRAG